MKYGDFSSLVQLGVGLHLGTALLQMYGDLGEAPFKRQLARIRMLVTAADPSSSLRDGLRSLEGDYEIFKIQFFNEYRKYIKINAAVAVLLVIVLALISFKNDDSLPGLIGILFLYCSVIPAPTTLAFLWSDAARALRPLKDRADDLEKRALKEA